MCVCVWGGGGGGTVSTWGKQKAEKASEMPIKRSLTVSGEHADRTVGSPSW